MGGFWNGLGTAIASQSAPGRAVYQAATGQVLPAPAGQPPNPGEVLAQSIVGRYRRGMGSGEAGHEGTFSGMGENGDAGGETKNPMPQAAPGSGPIPDSEQAAPPSQWNQPDQPGKSGGAIGQGLMSMGGSSGAQTGTEGLADLALMAHGGFAGHPMTAKVGESGPEFAGGQLVSSPSIVHLDKGDAVIPLTPRSSNKFQPDMMEGKVMPPKIPGVRYSRYKSFGAGKGGI